MIQPTSNEVMDLKRKLDEIVRSKKREEERLKVKQADIKRKEDEMKKLKDEESRIILIIEQLDGQISKIQSDIRQMSQAFEKMVPKK